MSVTTLATELFNDAIQRTAAAPGNLGVISSGSGYPRSWGPSAAALGLNAPGRSLAVGNSSDFVSGFTSGISGINAWEWEATLLFTSLGNATSAGHGADVFEGFVGASDALFVGVRQDGSLNAGNGSTGSINTQSAGFIQTFRPYRFRVRFSTLGNSLHKGKIWVKDLVSGIETAIAEYNTGTSGSDFGAGGDFTSVGLVNRGHGSTYHWSGRVGCVSLVQLSSFTDAWAGRTEFAAPVMTPNIWYLDPVNGNDASDGTASAPIKTLAELSRRYADSTILGSLNWYYAVNGVSTGVTVSSYLGKYEIESLLRSGGLVQGGDVVTISGNFRADAYVKVPSWAPNTRITGPATIYCDVMESGWTQYDAVNYPNVWKAINQPRNSYVWEDGKIIPCVSGTAILGAAASLSYVGQVGGTVNAASVAALLNANPGTQWNDGSGNNTSTTYYSTSDGQPPSSHVITRAVVGNDGGTPCVFWLQAPTRIDHLTARNWGLMDTANGSIGNNTAILFDAGGTGWYIAHNNDLQGAGKHDYAQDIASSMSRLIFLDSTIGGCHPSMAFGNYTATVDNPGSGTNLGIEVLYRNLTYTGLAVAYSSTARQASGQHEIYYGHGVDTTPYLNVAIEDCDFSMGRCGLDNAIAANLTIRNCKMGGFICTANVPINADLVTFTNGSTGFGVPYSNSTAESVWRRCKITLSGAISNGGSWNYSGTNTYRDVVIDGSGLTSANNDNPAIFKRSATSLLSLQNASVLLSSSGQHIGVCRDFATGEIALSGVTVKSQNNDFSYNYNADAVWKSVATIVSTLGGTNTAQAVNNLTPPSAFYSSASTGRSVTTNSGVFVAR